MAEKYYKVSEKQMELLCSIVNTVIGKSEGCKNGEWSVDTNGMIVDDEEMTWGFICGDDIEDAQENEEDVIDSLNFVLNDCIDMEPDNKSGLITVIEKQNGRTLTTTEVLATSYWDKETVENLSADRGIDLSNKSDRFWRYLGEWIQDCEYFPQTFEEVFDCVKEVLKREEEWKNESN